MNNRMRILLWLLAADCVFTLTSYFVFGGFEFEANIGFLYPKYFFPIQGTMLVIGIYSTTTFRVLVAMRALALLSHIIGWVTLPTTFTGHIRPTYNGLWVYVILSLIDIVIYTKIRRARVIRLAGN